jgi:hypothetical protein
MSVRQTILLRGDAERHAGPAGADITPGHLVAFDPSEPGGYIPHGEAGGQAAPWFARENWENDGAGIDDDIASGSEVVVVKPNLGATVNAVTADTIAIGDFVESAGDGTVRPHGSGYVIGVASKDSDLSGDVGRVEIIIAPFGA